MPHVSFDQMKAKLAQRPGVTNPGGLAAFIADRKYGKKAVQHAAQSGTSLKHHKALAKFVKQHHGKGSHGR